MAFQDKINKILYGGDYNPEQWDRDIWEQDMKLLKEAGLDIVTLNVFNWAMLQPDEETYDFTMLDETIERVSGEGMYICLATSTGAHPAWMARKYPDILRTEFNGMKRKFGGRHNSCPNSPTFQKYSVRLAGELARRYQNRENILLWHVNNEYGGACYCENCEKAFRVWLKKKYRTIEKLNREWNTHFWGHTYYDWDDIVLPNLLSEHFEEERSMHQGMTLDYMRFNSDSMLKNFKEEATEIKKYLPDAVVTTNLMGAYKQLDYKKWADAMDIISWDNYPQYKADPALTAMNHELMRGIKGGDPFLLMEQTPSVTNWLADNGLKRPGVMRLISFQAVAHGADTVMFFQMRRSPAGCEKFHGAVIDHVGTNRTRVYRECAALGNELHMLGDTMTGARVHADTAMIFDWDTWWAVECSAGPSTRLRYTEEFFQYYEALHYNNIAVDIIGMEDDFTKYKCVIAPLFYMVKGDVDERMKKYVKSGGRIVFTYMSGYVNENDYITVGGYPGKLREMAGIWAEEIDALAEEDANEFQFGGEDYKATLLCDILHLEGAQALASYEKDFYKGTPVITENYYGNGKVYYVGTRSERRFYRKFLEGICKECGIEPVLKGGEGIEITKRSKEGKHYYFLLNHAAETKEFEVPFSGTELLGQSEIHRGQCITLKPYDVFILEEKRG